MVYFQFNQLNQKQAYYNNSDFTLGLTIELFHNKKDHKISSKPKPTTHSRWDSNS